MPLLKPFFIAIALLLAQFSTSAQRTHIIPFTSDGWVFSEGTTFRIEKHLGKESVYLDGHAYLKNASLENGTIEVDVAPNTDRGFAGLTFRDQSEGNYEEVYLRMHKSGLPDAVQYSPFYNGEANWQLYPQHQAAVEFNTASWNHLRLVVNGSRLEVHVNGAQQPSMVVENLRHDAKAGTLGIWALFGNHFANFRYTPQDVGSSAPAPVLQAPPGMVTQWYLSPAFTTEQMDISVYPEDDEITWETVPTEATGLLPISKYRKKVGSGSFEANTDDVVLAKLIINADRKARRKFFFDYSDRVQVFLNRNPIFAGNNSFLSKGSLFRGDVHVAGNALYLNLEKGKNELLITVAERANGWGLIGQWADATGLRME